jgi:hypothetical protein
MWELNPRRAGSHYTTAQVVEKCVELYNHEYNAGSPYEYDMRAGARGIKTTPATSRHEQALA